VLRLPARAISEGGVIDTGSQAVALVACTTVNINLRTGDEQAALIGGEEERDAAELVHLVERLRARLDHGVEWGELLASNLPENASRRSDIAAKAEPDPSRIAVDLLRPLRLLRQPRPIRVIVRPSQSRDGDPVSFTDENQTHRLDHARGPERITGQWWNGRWKTRDYFDVLDIAGDRFWIFRVAQSGRWFLHGIFE
jgi:protein ImuB